jgi:hypothetical protein
MNSRTGFCKVVLVISFGLFLMSCGGMAMTKGQNWLDSKKNNPDINVSGTWTSPEWGTARFKQENRNVDGVLGDYPVKGVVSGVSIYLLMYSGSKVDYSAELQALDNNTFKGIYSKYATVDEAETTNKRQMNLKRVP